ncbi:hypothetical protein [Runella slithyformis]|uniref:Uncharacterized protein n=1 Tax=Runella slithyformis (strain ATCC 29530 / DSM 19594 / LMG 11500 / NCIMB 11436 / LSU 4) TaxID=761193 RepID=A0A7U3ZLY6_RUNSL|nr:hypothetical protein [Runella slithyformis]AEI49660.1 hypothetical protein Runsl_3285 [Runella slithyformis DSM 19594]
MKINTLIIDDAINWQKILSKFVQMNPLPEVVSITGETIPISDRYRSQINRKHIEGTLK